MSWSALGEAKADTASSKSGYGRYAEVSSLHLAAAAIGHAAP
jgi:hypothetical protein